MLFLLSTFDFMLEIDLEIYGLYTSLFFLCLYLVATIGRFSSGQAVHQSVTARWLDSRRPSSCASLVVCTFFQERPSTRWHSLFSSFIINNVLFPTLAGAQRQFHRSTSLERTSQPAEHLSSFQYHPSPVNKPRLSLTAPSTSTYDKNQIPDNESANYERMLHYRTLYITGLSQSQLHASLLATLPSIHFISERPRVHLPSIKQHIQKASIEKNYLIHNPKKPYTFSIRKKYLANGRCHF
ncbi:hypothetical protein BKA64DRAFT_184866 [Cadophora sp. MPI-SDFR-AT-0126]|nr:hypothetical protein BKA64DRAFT_184866 [Leotiomycetes sp. MPI-SDFR-AT-0126]